MAWQESSDDLGMPSELISRVWMHDMSTCSDLDAPMSSQPADILPFSAWEVNHRLTALQGSF